MSIEPEVPTEPTIAPQVHVAAGLDLAAGLQRVGKLSEAANELERAMATARATPYEIEFQTRIRLAMSLSDVYLSLDRIQNARALLADEVAFAQRISEIMQATGTPAQKRAATSGFLQVRDRGIQMAIIGQTAPEFSVRTWIKGDPGDAERSRRSSCAVGILGDMVQALSGNVSEVETISRAVGPPRAGDYWAHPPLPGVRRNRSRIARGVAIDGFHRDRAWRRFSGWRGRRREHTGEITGRMAYPPLCLLIGGVVSVTQGLVQETGDLTRFWKNVSPNLFRRFCCAKKLASTRLG